MNQHAHVEKLVRSERAAFAQQFGEGARRLVLYVPIEALTDEGRVVLLLLGGGAVVEGWMSRRFVAGRATYWTWDARCCRVSQFLPGVDPVVLAGCVEPVAWSEIPDGWVSDCEKGELQREPS